MLLYPKTHITCILLTWNRWSRTFQFDFLRKLLIWSFYQAHALSTSSSCLWLYYLCTHNPDEISLSLPYQLCFCCAESVSLSVRQLFWKFQSCRRKWFCNTYLILFLLLLHSSTRPIWFRIISVLASSSVSGFRRRRMDERDTCCT